LQSAGGIVSANLGHWQQLNGFSNDYFGWGGEDDELHHRLRLTGLLYGDCYPFCKPDDPSKGKAGISIKRPPKGHGRFSGKYMHSANHTKRITDHKAYQQNVKLLQQIQAGQPRWRSDGLSNLAFRIVSYERDTSYAKDGIIYHHVKARRGRDSYDVRGIQLAVPSSLCSDTEPESEDSVRWTVVALGDPIPWDLKSLRKRIGNILKDFCGQDVPPSADRANFIMVDRRFHFAKILSDDNAAMLVGFYRGLQDPLKDGLIIADVRTPDKIREAFVVVKARVNPPTEYTVCTSKLAGGQLKYSMHQGPACAGGWDKLKGGTFWAFTAKTPGMQAVSFCDNSRYWVQHILPGETCPEKWGGLKWMHGGTFWVPEGKQFCVGTRETGDSPVTVPGDPPFSMTLPEERCSQEPYTHKFNFGTQTYTHTFGSFTLCIARKDGVSKVAVDPHCEVNGFKRLLSFRVRLPKLAGSAEAQVFCVAAGTDGDVIKTDCDKGSLTFSVPTESVASSFKLVCSGPSLHKKGVNLVGIGPECEDGPSKTVDVVVSFQAPSVIDVAASTPVGGDAYPLYTLVDEDVSCMGLFCRNIMACAATHQDPNTPCPITTPT
jgi:hypothetical protein